MPRPVNLTLRDDILAAALRLVEEKGAAALTMREVAGALGYSATAIYQYFESKEDLLLGLKLQAGDLLATEMEIARQEPTLEAQLPAMGRRYIQFGLENPAYYRLIFQDSVPGLVFTPEQFDRMRRGWSIMRETLNAWVQQQHFRGVDVDQEAHVLWVIVHGITSLALAGRLPSNDHQAIFALFDQAAGRWASGILSMQAPQPKEKKRKHTSSSKRPATTHRPAIKIRRNTP